MNKLIYAVKTFLAGVEYIEKEENANYVVTKEDKELLQEAIDTVVAHLTSENKRDLDDSLRDNAVEQPENQDNTSHKLDKKYETYLPFWEEMKEDVLSRDPYPSPEFVSELQSILNRAYMNALEVGFNEGCRFSLDQKEKDMEAFAEWVDINGYKQILKVVWNRDISYQQKMTTTQLRNQWEEESKV